MKQKTNKMRLLVLAAVMVLTLVSLSACTSSKTTTKLTMQSTITAAEGGSLTAEQLKDIGNMLAAAYSDTEFDCRDMLIAASRGYDMLAEGFDDSRYEEMPCTADPAEKAAIAVKIIDKSKERVKNGLVDGSVYANMNEADLNQLIGIFAETVKTEPDSGFIYTIQSAVGKCLSWITRYLGFGSYILGICIFAVLIEILMLPFAVKQQKNSIKQANLRPKEMAIRNKYKGRNDQATMKKVNEEIQALYQKENFSPASGCLPLLLQLPIIIVLYNVVINPLVYVLGQASGVSAALSSYYTAARAAGGLGQTLQSARSTIELLSKNGIQSFEGIQNFRYFTNGGEIWESLKNVKSVPDFNIFGFNFGTTPSIERIGTPEGAVLLLVPVLTFVVYFLSMRLNRKFTVQPAQTGGMDDRQTACSNTMMDVTMPLMSTFFTFMVPAIIGVYWMFRSVIGILKQFIMSKIMPLPQFTEEDYKAAAREMAGKAPKKVAKSEKAGTVRSLHHIDDEDYDDTREKALERRAKMEELERQQQEEKSRKNPFGFSALKSDRKKETAEPDQASGSNGSDEPEKDSGKNNDQE